jgi:hypothetical protein
MRFPPKPFSLKPFSREPSSRNPFAIFVFVFKITVPQIFFERKITIKLKQ